MTAERVLIMPRLD